MNQQLQFYVRMPMQFEETFDYFAKIDKFLYSFVVQKCLETKNF